ncbi:MAG: hypothetical protein HY043_02915 [Verrucomicrobia bacterium]|nr:hypothetical protein [Verrucomicrobiota bacterium]
MKILLSQPRTAQGYALMMVMGFVGLGLLIVGGALTWTSNSAQLTARNNQYFSCVAAAEAATEKVLARMNYDYMTQGAATVAANINVYRDLVPTTSESSTWANFSFVNNSGAAGHTTVNNSVAWGFATLQSQYSGLQAYAATYSVSSSAHPVGSPYTISAGVQQDFQIASIPIFQFAIFYSMDLEINPGPNMTVTGRVHGNNNIYLQPQASLTFQTDVTAAGTIIQGKSPLDPLTRTPGTISFLGEHDSGVASLNLPIGTNNTPASVQAILNIPPSGESPTSLMGQQRFYNQCDLIVVVSNSAVTVKSGLFNNFATAIPSAQYNLFINTNVSFYNSREAKTIKTTEIDVSKLRTWSATNAVLRSSLGRDVSSIYVADLRTQTGSTESGVRVVNGQTLPPLGLTVATPNPMYVKGHYNAPAGFLGTTNTTTTLPAALIGDSINVLSTSWSDANSALALGSRTAGNTTVNAAFLGGIVPSNGTYYSGGVENFPRFLESWSGYTFTYNGSMVVMYYSQYATAPWLGTGSTIGVYNPPTRNWTFDLNFMDPTKLPPATPQLRKTVRGQWSLTRGS